MPFNSFISSTFLTSWLTYGLYIYIYIYLYICAHYQFLYN